MQCRKELYDQLQLQEEKYEKLSKLVQQLLCSSASVRLTKLEKKLEKMNAHRRQKNEKQQNKQKKEVKGKSSVQPKVSMKGDSHAQYMDVVSTLIPCRIYQSR